MGKHLSHVFLNLFPNQLTLPNSSIRRAKNVQLPHVKSQPSKRLSLKVTLLPHEESYTMFHIKHVLEKSIFQILLPWITKCLKLLYFVILTPEHFHIHVMQMNFRSLQFFLSVTVRCKLIKVIYVSRGYNCSLQKVRLYIIM